MFGRCWGTANTGLDGVGVWVGVQGTSRFLEFSVMCIATWCGVRVGRLGEVLFLIFRGFDVG